MKKKGSGGNWWPEGNKFASHCLRFCSPPGFINAFNTFKVNSPSYAFYVGLTKKRLRDRVAKYTYADLNDPVAKTLPGSRSCYLLVKQNPSKSTLNYIQLW